MHLIVIISGQRVSYLKGSYDKDKFILRPELCGRFHKLMEEAFPSPASRFGGVQTVIGAPGMGKTFLVHWFAETYDSWYD